MADTLEQELAECRVSVGIEARVLKESVEKRRTALAVQREVVRDVYAIKPGSSLLDLADEASAVANKCSNAGRHRERQELEKVAGSLRTAHLHLHQALTP